MFRFFVVVGKPFYEFGLLAILDGWKVSLIVSMYQYVSVSVSTCQHFSVCVSMCQ